MSRIGFMPVAIPNGVNVSISKNTIQVKGSKGELSQTYLPLVDFEINDGEVLVSRKNESRQAKAMHGLYRSLLNNMVMGVSRGFSQKLVINGVGYRAELSGNTLILSLGYSMPVEYIIPKDITIAVEGNNRIEVSGIHKDAVGQTAAEIRKLRPCEPYKGKGIRYETEVIRRKVGKTGTK